MKNQEMIQRNITLSFDFLRQIVNNPSILEGIPDGSVIDFIQRDIPAIEGKEKKQPRKMFKVNYQFEPL